MTGSGRSSRVTVIRVSDPPDQAASTLEIELNRAIDDPRTRVVVDLSPAAAVDATVLALLVRTGRHLRCSGRILRVSLSSLPARRLLAATMLDRTFTVCATLGEALQPARTLDESG
jgi:anti-anti-sigma regulatory factor